jgi:hypothetical protein
VHFFTISFIGYSINVAEKMGGNVGKYDIRIFEDSKAYKGGSLSLSKGHFSILVL